jgi:2-polyprenyl-6-methoxyphenol hydroxylase-like FAD-dependent oxidoreductase
MFDQRGIAKRFLAEGHQAQVATFGSVRLDIGDFPTRHPYGLGLWQNHIERILASWAEQLQVRIYRDQEVAGFEQDDTGVAVVLADGTSLRADYLVGCDGGRSVVRKTAGIDFPGWDATTSHLLAEVQLTGSPPLGIHRTALGIHSFGRLEYEIVDGQVVFKDTGPMRLMVTEGRPGPGAEPTLHDLRTALLAACGTDYGLYGATWISRFTDATRQAATYRDRRVLLAGDAAHVHSPVGGQGLNTGVQDAMNLGWKLAQVVRGQSPDRLLDTYHAERHPVAARVLRNTMAQAPLQHTDDRTEALRTALGELLGMDEPRRRFGAMQSGLDIHYGLGDGHPLLGRRMPDLELATADGPLRMYTLLHAARPVLLDLGQSGSLGADGWTDRVRQVDASYAGRWELPSIGEVAPPAAVLVRPDGYVAWVGTGTNQGLDEALATSFGPPH